MYLQQYRIVSGGQRRSNIYDSLWDSPFGEKHMKSRDYCDHINGFFLLRLADSAKQNAVQSLIPCYTMDTFGTAFNWHDKLIKH